MRGTNGLVLSGQGGHMVAGLSETVRTLLAKAATDNGFDVQMAGVQAGLAQWEAFVSSQTPLEVWISPSTDGSYVVAFSSLEMAQNLTHCGAATASAMPMPPAANSICGCKDLNALHHLLRRAFQLSRTLPNELLSRFQHAVAGLPSSTEAERTVVVRVGQDLFRQGLLDFWEGRCAITGLAVPELLRASHIKPWADCTADAERLDVFNGLLLAPHLDAAFDRGFLTVNDDGKVQVSTTLASADRQILGLDRPLKVARLHERHRAYLAWHRERVWRPGP